MIVELVQIEKPFFTSYELFSPIDLELLEKTKEILVTFDFIGKTRVSTSMQVGKAKYKINLQMPEFNQFEHTQYNSGAGEMESSFYYVISKKFTKQQSFENYKLYVQKLIELIVTTKFKLDLDKITIQLAGSF